MDSAYQDPGLKFDSLGEEWGTSNVKKEEGGG